MCIYNFNLEEIADILRNKVIHIIDMKLGEKKKDITLISVISKFTVSGQEIVWHLTHRKSSNHSFKATVKLTYLSVKQQTFRFILKIKS